MRASRGRATAASTPRVRRSSRSTIRTTSRCPVDWRRPCATSASTRTWTSSSRTASSWRPGTTGPRTPWVRPEVARSLVGRAVGVGDVFRWNLGQLQGMCFTRRCLDAVGGFDPHWDVLEDLDLMLRVTVRFRAAFLDVPAFRYRRHGDGASADRLHLRETSIRVADALMARHPEALVAVGPAAFRRRQARRWATLATMRRAAGDVPGARTALAGAVRLAPGHVGYRLRALGLTLRAR